MSRVNTTACPSHAVLPQILLHQTIVVTSSLKAAIFAKSLFSVGKVSTVSKINIFYGISMKGEIKASIAQAPFFPPYFTKGRNYARRVYDDIIGHGWGGES